MRIDGELYWDGGILSNTPTEVIFDDNPRRNSLIFAVHLWNPMGAEPDTIWRRCSTGRRTCSIRAGSPATSRASSRRIGCATSSASSSEAPARTPYATPRRCRELAGYGCLTRMHVVRLLAPQLDNEDHTKDVDFSPSGIRKRWDAGYRHTKAVLERKPWIGEFDPLSGVVLHEQMESMPEAAEQLN